MEEKRAFIYVLCIVQERARARERSTYHARRIVFMVDLPDLVGVGRKEISGQILGARMGKGTLLDDNLGRNYYSILPMHNARSVNEIVY